jgi:hypothetical protein
MNKRKITGKTFDFPVAADRTLRISNLSFIEGLLQIQSLADILVRKQGME